MTDLNVGLADGASIIAILTGILVGFRWLSRKIEGWIKGTVKDELSDLLENTRRDHEIRLTAVEEWIKGYQAAKTNHLDVPVYHQPTDEHREA